MATPTKAEIEAKALELWRSDQVSNGCIEALQLTPELEELKESGFYMLAQNMLMRNDSSYQDYIEREYNETVGKNKPTSKSQKQLDEFDKLKAQHFMVDIQELLRSGFYVTGTTGTGKSDIGMYAAEKLIQHGVIVIVFDSTQDWQSRSNIPYYITIKRHEPLDMILDRSIIYDIHKLFPSERQQLVERFCGVLYMHQASKPKHLRKQYFVIFEDSQTYLWQNSLRSRKAQNTAMLLTEGRNYKVRFGCIVQFSSMVDKNAMRYMKQRFLGWTNERNDIEYLRSFIGDKVNELKTLKAGEFVYSHPSQNTLEKIEIEAFESVTKPRMLPTPSPRLTPSTPQAKAQPSETDHKTLVSLAIALMWFIAILLALSQMIR